MTIERTLFIRRMSTESTGRGSTPRGGTSSMFETFVPPPAIQLPVLAYSCSRGSPQGLQL